jgi:hypothetical protein
MASAASDSISEQQEDQRWDELAKKIREPNEKLLAEWQKEEKKRQLSNRLAAKADKLLIKDSIRERKEAGKLKRPGGFTGRVAKRTAGAGLSFVGDLIGGIPVAGAIFKALKEEASATLDARREYKEELKAKRQEEIDLLDELAERRKQKIKQEAADREAEEAAARAAMEPANEEMTEAAEKVSAAAVDLAPVVESFGQIMERFIEKMPAGPSGGTVAEGTVEVDKIRDPKVLEYLHGIEWYAQEGVAQAERFYGPLLDTVERRAKDIGNIKWHVARANGSIGRMEQMMKMNQTHDMEVKEILQDTHDLTKKALEVQEDTRFAQILSVLTNLISGGGLLKALGGAAAGLGKAAVAGVAIVGAWEVGQAIGEALSKWLETTSWFQPAMEKLFQAMDAVLAFFGNDESKRRLNVQQQQDDVAHGNELMQKALGRQMTPQEEDYVRKNGTLEGLTKEQFNNDSIIPFSNIDEKDQLEMVRSGVFDKATHKMTPDEFSQYSKEIRDKAAAAQQANVNQNNVSTTNNNSQTVVPQVLSADPSKEIKRVNR